MINAKRMVIVVTLMMILTEIELGSVTSTVSGQQPPENKEITKSIDIAGIDDYFELVVDKSSAAARGDKPFLLVFHAPWCGHCQKLHPVLDQLQAQYGEEVVIAKANCQSSEVDPVCDLYDLKAYPTIFLLKKQMAYMYNVRRSGDR